MVTEAIALKVRKEEEEAQKEAKRNDWKKNRGDLKKHI